MTEGKRVETSRPTIAVILCAYTEARWDDLVTAVESIQAQSLMPDEIVIVIDHNPDLLQRAQSYFTSLKVVANTGVQGLSEARNSGIAATGAEWIAFLDDDAAAEADWLQNLARALDDPHVLGAGGRINPRWAGGKPAWFPEGFNWVVGCSHRGLPLHTAEVRNLVGASMLIRRSVFETVGGFRSEIGRVGSIPLGCEETELCIRARQRIPGSRFMYEPSAQVWHRVPASRMRWSYFRSRCYAEGVSKAVVAQFVGSKDGLASERAYVLKTLPVGVLRGVADAVIRRDSAGLGRAGAITSGLFFTCLGYLRGVIGRRSSSMSADEAAPAQRPLRILMVSARYFPLMGGTETHIYETARRMAGEGHSVTVLTTDPEGTLPRDEVRENVRILRVKAYPRNRDYYFAPGLFPVIVRGHAGGRWDVVHIQGYHTLVAPLAMLASWLARIPFVVTFHSGGHSSEFRNSLRGIQRRLLKPLLRRAAQLIGVSQFEANFFAESLGLDRARFTVIPNGAHLPALSHPVEPAPYPLIVSSGRLERYKGHQHVIAAMPRVRESRPGARLRIAGSGPYEQALYSLASNLGVSDCVEIGSIPPGNREGMAELFSNASLVTLMSEYEAHPVAVMEALSLKRPVLVADTSGLRELAQKGWVRAVAANASADDLAEAILEELDHPHIPPPISLPTWEDCVAQLLTVYRCVASREQSV
jgi:glycosyltransferase involved in cell wall biosynthesis/GT2 family glycosyltransferase